ncbi:MAG: hypothetical protein ACYC6Y_05590 [Thermoguttaceae bacterium]
MSLMYWLRKLGIIHFGAEGGVYHNAAERPTSLQMDGVFDSKKELVDCSNRVDTSTESPLDSGH